MTGAASAAIARKSTSATVSVAAAIAAGDLQPLEPGASER